ncbi:MAG: hypothetical protein A3D16_11190 [Rhodobacterales bacterium RIFCSPHIGHO2_02_FULL_62_130]|jgi:uncharacterized protein (DUF924 family)|nr:MAG: hypothetical protein A3D16_11190 [Rhodobacterales bacterium RIFCSPHIGHO2_02_FULL_62_130]OHC56542.1 MAG: hypothetical protein A3E48_22115 [Rhodobacterales bacterium RIFCSPHIGHO2_12_FULL_62_75]
MSDPIEILDFWLGEVGPQGWYAAGEALDADIRDRFLDVWTAAHEGGLEHWVDGTVGTLAYLILCDQLSRNMHRGDARAFATDARALAAAKRAVAEGWDMGAPEPERQFFYMPYEHSEDSDDQALAVALLTERLGSDPEMALHARAHQAVIARFGRFPTRNAALGRASTPEEEGYLADGGYMAVVAALKSSHATSA